MILRLFVSLVCGIFFISVSGYCNYAYILIILLPGTYLPLTLDDGEDSENNDTNNCVPASPGHFSIGGGIIADVFDSWDTVPLEFGRESTWVFLGELIRSGEGDSELNAYIDVVRG